MIDWLWTKVEAITNRTTFFGLLLFFFTFSALFNLCSEHYPRSSFDGTTFGISPSDVKPILQEFDWAGQLDRYFAQETQLDLAFPAIYGLLFAVAVVGLRPKGWHWLVALPLAMAVFDYCENVSFIALVVCYHKVHTVPWALAVVASIFSRLKWAFVFPAALSPLVALVRRYC